MNQGRPQFSAGAGRGQFSPNFRTRHPQPGTSPWIPNLISFRPQIRQAYGPPQRPERSPQRYSSPQRPDLNPQRYSSLQRPDLNPQRYSSPQRPDLNPPRYSSPQRPDLNPQRYDSPQGANLRTLMQGHRVQQIQEPFHFDFNQSIQGHRMQRTQALSRATQQGQHRSPLRGHVHRARAPQISISFHSPVRGCSPQLKKFEPVKNAPQLPVVKNSTQQPAVQNALPLPVPVVKSLPHLPLFKNEPQLPVVKDAPKLLLVKETPKLKEAPKVPMVKETPKAPLAKETHKVLLVKEAPKLPMVKGAPKAPLVKETPKAPLVKETPKVLLVKEAPKLPMVKEAPKAPLVKEAAQVALVKEVAQVPLVKEAVQVPLVKEAAQVLLVKEAPKLSLVKDTPQALLVKEAPKLPIVNEIPQAPLAKETTQAPLVKEAPQVPLVKDVLQVPLVKEGPHLPFVQMPMSMHQFLQFNEGRPRGNRRNEVEIITFNKDCGNYANMVEKEIKDLGLSVDQLFFCNPDSKVSGIMRLLSQHGTLFALVIRPDNETHRSVTAFFLEPTKNAEEHRNMPLPTAFEVIGNRFAEIKRKKFERNSISPEEVRIMESVLEGKFLSDTEYQDIIGMVHKQWKYQRELDKRVDFDEGTGISTKLELQHRVLKIMGGDTGPIGQSLAVAVPGSSEN